MKIALAVQTSNELKLYSFLNNFFFYPTINKIELFNGIIINNKLFKISVAFSLVQTGLITLHAGLAGQGLIMYMVVESVLVLYSKG